MNMRFFSIDPAPSGVPYSIIARLCHVVTAGLVYLIYFCLFTGTIALDSHATDQPKPDVLIDKANEAIQQGNYKVAMTLLDQAVAAAPGQTIYLLKRASLHHHLRQHDLAIRDCDVILEAFPEQINVLQLRGSAKFKLGDIDGSIQDFDAAITLEPQLEVSHWQRGISYYYASKFAAGTRQFQLYQTFDGGDVENVVWRFICQARTDGVEKARADILRLEAPDSRIPMAEIYDLYRGQKSSEDVLQAAQKGVLDKETLKVQLFYAHLYIGLYYEATGNAERASQHLLEADRRQISHYMWDVAHVHVQRLQDKAVPGAND